MTQATSKDYWISPNALYIELNALGNPDYIQASCVSGAQILVYVNGIISYDAGHNYRRWSLQANPTVFNEHKTKYVYAAIPRDTSSTKSALIVFPSEQIDIYGKNASETQIGSEEYYYIYLQGIISSSGDNGSTSRDWAQRISTGTLSSDEAINAKTNESEWYKYSSVDDITTFLKDLTMKVGTKFYAFFAKAVTIVSGGSITFEGQGELNGIANDDSAVSDDDKIVTPAYMSTNSISKKSPDTAAALIRFLKGISLGDTSTAYGIGSDGLAVLEGILSDGFTPGALGSGLCLTMEPESVEGGGKYAYLEVDRLLVRKAAEFLQVVIRELKHVGGEILLSPASMKCIKVEVVKDSLTGSVTAYRCYFRKTDNDGTYVDNPFATGDLVRCQRFNLTDSTDNARTFYYWRKCVAVGSDYIELSATDYDTTTANNTPQEGDEMVQLGSTTDTTRQSAILLSSYGADAPSVTMYRGVNSYSLTGKEQFQVSASKVLVIADELYFTTDGGKRNVKDAITTIETNAEGMKASIADHGTRLTTIEATASGLKTSVEAHESRIASNESSISANTSSISTNTSKISDLSTEIDNVSSSIEQTARKISLEVTETTTGLKNMLTGTAFREWDTIPQVKTNYPVTRLAAGGVAGSDCGVLDVSGLSSSQASYCGVKRTVTLTPGKTYTYSFWAKVETVCDGSAYSRIYYETRTTGIRYIAIKAAETSDWKRYEWTFECPEEAEEVLLETAISRNGRVLICREMLMEGDTYEGWSLSPDDVTESGSLESKVIKAGIDIEAGKITATADKFEVKNTDGDVTASVNADGLLEVGSGLFTGFVMKKPTTMTPDNIDSLVSKTIQNGYVNVDYIKTGSYIIFSGDMNTKFGSDMPTLVLPTTENDLDTLNVDLGVALQYLGQTFIVKNESNATVNILGGGTIRSIDTPTNQLSNGKYAVLTSTLSYSSGKLSVAWSGYIGK